MKPKASPAAAAIALTFPRVPESVFSMSLQELFTAVPAFLLALLNAFDASSEVFLAFFPTSFIASLVSVIGFVSDSTSMSTVTDFSSSFFLISSSSSFAFTASSFSRRLKSFIAAFALTYSPLSLMSELSVTLSISTDFFSTSIFCSSASISDVAAEVFISGSGILSIPFFKSSTAFSACSVSTVTGISPFFSAVSSSGPALISAVGTSSTSSDSFDTSVSAASSSEVSASISIGGTPFIVSLSFFSSLKS